LLDTIPDFLQGVWRGETQKVAIMATIVILVLLALLIRWLWGPLRANRPPQLPEGPSIEDDWKAPSSEEVGRMIGTKNR
jgi:hypothetical protein